MSNLMKGKALVIHVGDDETRIACLTLGAKIPQVLDSAVFATPEGAVQDGVIQNLEALQMQLALEMDMHPAFKKARKAVFVLQSTQVISQSISVPQVKNKKRVEQLVQTNADLYFPVDITDYQLTWQVVGTETVDEAPMTRIQLWATPKTLLSQYYLLANDCGFTVAAVDYCGHSFASGINASFAKGKAVKKVPQKVKKTNAYEEYDPLPPEEEDTTIFINLEKSHILMSFVQENQVLLQRMFRRSDNPDADLNEVFMELEYFRSMFPACEAGACVVSGGETEDTQLMEGLEDVTTLPLKRLHCDPDQIWIMHLGASLTELDFGDAELNIRKDVGTRLGSPWQYVAVALGGAALVGSLLLFLSSSTIWNAELNGLRTQQNGLMLQLAESGNAAKEYKAYEALYNAYNSDWETVFEAARTYNDNACLILEEIEDILPSSSVVTNMTMTEQSLSLETAFQSKEDVVYYLVALRDLQYATLDDISDLIPLAQQAVEEPPADSNPGGGSALMNMMSSLLGGGGLSSLFGGEKAPSEGGFEAAPTEGDRNMDMVEDIKSGKIDPLELLTDEYFAALIADDEKNNRSEADSLRGYMMKIMIDYIGGNLDENNLDHNKLEKMATIYWNVKEGNPGGSGTGGTTGGTSSGSTGSSGSLGDLGSLVGGLISGGAGSGSSSNRVPTGQELEDLLARYELTEQHLKDGLDNLETAVEMGVLDKNYSKLYERNTFRVLLKEGATLAQRQEAIRNLLVEDDALALHQFFLLMQEDQLREGRNNVLMSVIRDDFWEEPQLNVMIRSSDQAMLDKYLPQLIDMLVKNEDTVAGTENLIKTSYNLTRKLAGHLAVAMGKESSYTSKMDFAKLQNDILSAKTHKNPELDTVVRKMLTPKALEYYNSIEAGKAGSTGSTGAGDMISNLLGQLLGGGFGSGGQDVVLEELPGNFSITVTLGYKQELIEAEQARKGLDYNAKVEKVEVAG